MNSLRIADLAYSYNPNSGNLVYMETENNGTIQKRKSSKALLILKALLLALSGAAQLVLLIVGLFEILTFFPSISFDGFLVPPLLIFLVFYLLIWPVFVFKSRGGIAADLRANRIRERIKRRRKLEESST